jgi:hypothetical protein
VEKSNSCAFSEHDAMFTQHLVLSSKLDKALCLVIDSVGRYFQPRECG